MYDGLKFNESNLLCILTSKLLLRKPFAAWNNFLGVSHLVKILQVIIPFIYYLMSPQFLQYPHNIKINITNNRHFASVFLLG